MQYSPKLKMAMEEVKAILKKHDIAAIVCLHTPGYGEYLVQLDPSYSCARFEHMPDGQLALHLRAKLQEDFKGDKEAWHQKVTDTVNMIDVLAIKSGEIAMGLMDTMDMVRKKMEVESDRGPHTSHNQQNN